MADVISAIYMMVNGKSMQITDCRSVYDDLKGGTNGKNFLTRKFCLQEIN